MSSKDYRTLFASKNCFNRKIFVRLSELHNVSHSRDKTLSQDREYRQRQMNFLQRDVANMPPEALAEIFGPDYNTYARNLHNPSTNLLDWLFGSKSSNEPEN